MKKIFLVLICVGMTIHVNSQSFIGAWEGFKTSGKGEKLKVVVIFADGYQVLSTYNAKTGAFINTNGGTWKLDGDMMTEKVEFSSNNPERVGSETSFKISIKDSIIEIDEIDLKLKRIDAGAPGKLNGAWLMSGRIRDGKTQNRDTTRSRKTMKILSGTRFQWIAYNTETKKFMGTGGGTYTTINGEYTEKIEFFSRDDSKVGLSLAFDFSLENGTWNHKGFSSKGAAMHEIWRVRN